MDSWIKDVAFVVIGWLLGLFTLPIAKDFETKEKCLKSLYDLKRLLENLFKYKGYPNKSENGYFERLQEIKLIIEKLDVEKNGLALSCYFLNDLIAESLLIFKKLDPEHENPAYHPSYTVVMLIQAWDRENVYRPNFDDITMIQKFISSSLPKRCLLWFYSVFIKSSYKLFRKKTCRSF